MQQRDMEHLRRVGRRWAGPFHALSGSQRGRYRLLAAAAAVLGTAGAGCSLLYDLSADQCVTSDDCAVFGSGYSCNAVHVCEAPIDSNGGSSGSGGSSAGVGGDAGSGPAGNGGSAGTGGSAGSGPDLECTTNQDCITSHAGQPWICRDNECLDLTSDECPFVMGEANLTSANPIIFGAYTVRGLESIRQSEPTANYEMAIDEFTTGAPNGGLQNGQRKFVAVACDGLSPDTLDASIDHLIDVVRVPAIITPLSAPQIVAQFERRGRDAGVFFMSPYDADSSLTTLDDSGLVWHMLGSYAGLAASYVPLLARAEALIQPEPVIEPLRVALIDDDTVAQQDISAVLRSSSSEPPLIFNGLSVAANATAEDYIERRIPSDPEAAGSDDAYIQVLEDLLDFQPHVIVSAAGFTFVTDIMGGLEETWDASVPSQPRPFYLLGPYQAGLDRLRDLVQDQNAAQLSERIIGVNFESAVDDSVVIDYRLRFNSRYSNATPPLADFYENFYDAIWYLMYSFAAAGNVDYTGNDVRIGMQRLLRVDDAQAPVHQIGGGAGSADVAGVLAAIANRGNLGIQLVGTMGPPDFDPVSGSRDTRGSAFCTTAAGGFMFDVLRYNETGPAMEGDPSGTCVPPGF